MKLCLHEVDKFFSCGIVAEEQARECAGGRNGILLLNTAHLHAHVGAFDDDGDALGIQRLLNAVADLYGEAFLYLQAAGERIDDPRNFAQSDDCSVWNVSYMGFSEEREHVVLAHGIDLDVFHDDHFGIFFMEQSAFEDVFRVDVVTVCEVLQRFRNALGCLEQSFAVGIFSYVF